jgi:Cu2+-exporting ATPase
MDVPIALAITLSYVVSLWETLHQRGQHAWFDATVSLLFFLLIGRTLDHVMRDRARAAISGPCAAVAAWCDGARGGWRAGIPSDRGHPAGETG